jgi:hypothetical protein
LYPAENRTGPTEELADEPDGACRNLALAAGAAALGAAAFGAAGAAPLPLV